MRCLQFAVWENFELLRTFQNRISDFGMFVEIGMDLEPRKQRICIATPVVLAYKYGTLSAPGMAL